jgi:mannose-1-phosphate guanylyltransferase
LQALILAGGEGTRLRPLTSTIPKPIVTLVDRPFIVYMIEWLRGYGVDDVILACGFMAADVKAELGSGEAFGVRLRYIEEPHPLGTGGAVKYAEDRLEGRFLVLNGDVLTDIDLGAQLAQHAQTGARATLALVEVEDPTAYGLVRCDGNGAVTAFVEKPGPGEPGPNHINAGAYILERDVLDEMAPAGTKISIERDVFPQLVGRGLFGYVARGYWMDIGTPERYLQASFDILSGAVKTELSDRLIDGLLIEDGAVEGTVRPPALVRAGSEVAPDAIVGRDAVLGLGVSVGEGAVVERSVVLDGAAVGAGSTVKSTIVGPRAQIGEGCQIEGKVLGEGAVVSPGSTLAPGARIFPGVAEPTGATEG